MTTDCDFVCKFSEIIYNVRKLCTLRFNRLVTGRQPAVIIPHLAPKLIFGIVKKLCIGEKKRNWICVRFIKKFIHLWKAKYLLVFDRIVEHIFPLLKSRKRSAEIRKNNYRVFIRVSVLCILHNFMAFMFAQNLKLSLKR